MRAGYQAKSPAVCYLIDHNLAFDPQCDISEFDLHVFSPRHRDWVYDLLDDLPEKDAVLNSVTFLLNRGVRSKLSEHHSMNTPLLYSIVRYAPYAETEEFANVGVVICAPKLSCMVYKLTKTNDARVKNFFKDDTIFHVVKPSIDRELQIAASIISELHSPEKIRDFFYTFTSPKESIFYYSPPRVLLACDCKEELSKLFNKFVKRTEHTKEKREKY